MKNKFYLFLVTTLFLVPLLFTSCSHDDDPYVENDTSVIVPTEPGESSFTNILYDVNLIGEDTQIFNSFLNGGTVKWYTKCRYTPSQDLPTGLYVSPNTPLVINVDVIEGASLPTVIIGTIDRRGRHIENLKLGKNIITQDVGGLIWISYSHSTVQSKCKVTFESGHKQAAFFVKNKTTRREWEERWDNSSDINDVILIGQYSVLVFSKNLHEDVYSQDNNVVLRNSDNVYKQALDISGLDGSAPVHTPHPAPHLFVQPDAAVGQDQGEEEGEIVVFGTRGVAHNFRTTYISTSRGVFSEDLTWNNAISTMGHEVGHMFQQWDWMFIHDTNNIYAIQIRSRYLGEPTYQNFNNGIWATLLDFFDDDSPSKSIDQLGAGDKQQAMLHQLYFAFGEGFYSKFMKLIREDPNGYTGDDRKSNFMIKSCIVSGKDLSVFFKKWGLLPPSHDVYNQIRNLNLPEPVSEPHLFPYDSRPFLVNGGIYEIQPYTNSSSVLTVTGNITDSKPLVTINTRISSKANFQRFLVRKMPDGKFVFKVMADTTKVLSVENNPVILDQVFVASFTGNNNQKWRPFEFFPGYLSLRSYALENAYLDVENGSSYDGTKVNIFTNNVNVAQKFKFIKMN